MASVLVPRCRKQVEGIPATDLGCSLVGLWLAGGREGDGLGLPGWWGSILDS